MADVLLGLPDPLLSDIKMAEMKLRARQNNDEGQDDGDEDGGGGGRSSAKKGSRGGRKNLRGGIQQEPWSVMFCHLSLINVPKCKNRAVVIEKSR